MRAVQRHAQQRWASVTRPAACGRPRRLAGGARRDKPAPSRLSAGVPRWMLAFPRRRRGIVAFAVVVLGCRDGSRFATRPSACLEGFQRHPSLQLLLRDARTCGCPQHGHGSGVHPAFVIREQRVHCLDRSLHGDHGYEPTSPQPRANNRRDERLRRMAGGAHEGGVHDDATGERRVAVAAACDERVPETCAGEVLRAWGAWQAYSVSGHGSGFVGLDRLLAPLCCPPFSVSPMPAQRGRDTAS